MTGTVNVDTLVSKLERTLDWIDLQAGVKPDTRELRPALSDLAARARHMEQWPNGSTEVQFCLHERRCLELREAEADRDQLEAALRRVEWNVEHFCEWCGNYQEQGHKPDCQRQAALAGDGGGA